MALPRSPTCCGHSTRRISRDVARSERNSEAFTRGLRRFDALELEWECLDRGRDVGGSVARRSSESRLALEELELAALSWASVFMEGVCFFVSSLSGHTVVVWLLAFCRRVSSGGLSSVGSGHATSRPEYIRHVPKAVGGEKLAIM